MALVIVKRGANVVTSTSPIKIRDVQLIDDLQRVRYAAGPEGIPDSIDLALDVASDHVCRVRCRGARRRLLQSPGSILQLYPTASRQPRSLGMAGTVSDTSVLVCETDG